MVDIRKFIHQAPCYWFAPTIAGQYCQKCHKPLTTTLLALSISPEGRVHKTHFICIPDQNSRYMGDWKGPYQ